MARPRDPEMLERIARGAMYLLSRRGFEQTRMSDIAREVGVSPGTLYNYVEGKQALFYLLIDWGMGEGPPELPERLPLETPPVEAVVRRLRERVGSDFSLERLDRALGEAVPDDPARELRAVLRELFERTADTREPVDVLERSAPELPEPLGEFFFAVRRSIFERFERYLQRRMDAGAFAKLGPPAVVSRMLVESVTFAGRHRHCDPETGKASDEVYGRVVVDLWLNALIPGGGGEDR